MHYYQYYFHSQVFSILCFISPSYSMYYSKVSCLCPRREAVLCVLASNCDEMLYVKLIEALCSEHNINLLKVIVM